MAGRKRFPLVMMLEPLHTCNLRCSGCGRIREYADTLDRMMTVEECMESVSESGAPIVTICGGEPLVYPHIGELVRRLTETRHHIYLCTNALLLKRKLSEFTPSSRLIFNVHLDGQEQVHDMIVDQKGTFAIAIEAVAAAKTAGFLVTSNTTVYQQTEMSDVEGLLEQLHKLGVDSHMISPAYDYEAVLNGELFLRRADTAKKFSDIQRLAKKFPLSDTPIYLDFLQGFREMPCSAWGNPTRNPVGWRSPCYMLADKHYPTFRELMENTDWDAYGPGKDERCQDCMVHCGFEPSVVLSPRGGIRDMIRMALWQLA
jgi:hopanoid biosynthesis associated radical SAM protein HpnH